MHKSRAPNFPRWMKLSGVCRERVLRQWAHGVSGGGPEEKDQPCRRKKTIETICHFKIKNIRVLGIKNDKVAIP